MTQQELEDEVIAKIKALYKRAMTASLNFAYAKLKATGIYEAEMHRIETDRLRVLLDHTIQALRIK